MPNNLFRLIRLVPVAAAVVVLAGWVQSTKLTAVWADPAAGSIRFNKIVVAFQSSDEVLRRNAEVTFVKKVPKSTAAYTLLAANTVRDREQAKAIVERAGFDGAVVMRIVRQDKETVYSPGTSWWGTAPYGSMWGYWGYGWGTAYQPGYITNDTYVTIETNVYAVKDDKLLWASRSESANPETVTKLINKVIETNIKEMKKRKIL